MIKYVKGNLFELLPKDGTLKVICHVANDYKVMGSGFALGLVKKWPIVREINKSTTLGDIEVVYVESDIMVVNMIAQHKTIRENPKPIRYEALVKCMVQVRDTIINGPFKNYMPNKNISLHCPKFGSLRARGNWTFIEELIEEIWKDVDITIYELGE